MDPIQIAALIFLLCGLALPVTCIIKMYMIKKFKQKAITTEAVITNIEKRRAYKGGVYYIFNLRYRVPETNTTYTNATALSGKNCKPGDTIPLMYLANNPAKYKTDFGKRLSWLLGFSIIFLGLMIWLSYWLLNSGYYEVKPVD
jgi:Protein of unknown function (DUF3592)